MSRSMCLVVLVAAMAACSSDDMPAGAGGTTAGAAGASGEGGGGTAAVGGSGVGRAGGDGGSGGTLGGAGGTGGDAGGDGDGDGDGDAGQGGASGMNGGAGGTGGRSGSGGMGGAGGAADPCADVDCDDGNDCTVDTCLNGDCRHANEHRSGIDCNDGFFDGQCFEHEGACHVTCGGEGEPCCEDGCYPDLECKPFVPDLGPIVDRCQRAAPCGAAAGEQCCSGLDGYQLTWTCDDGLTCEDEGATCQ